VLESKVKDMDIIYANEERESDIMILGNREKIVIQMRNAYGTVIEKSISMKEVPAMIGRLSDYIDDVQA
jgi:hypothetical protein